MSILTKKQTRDALSVDDDFDPELLEEYSAQASAFIYQKTGYDFAKEEVKNPLVILCAKLYVKTLHFNNKDYNKEYDFTLGINSLIVDLQTIAKEKLDNE